MTTDRGLSSTLVQRRTSPKSGNSFIAEDKPLAARRMREEILDCIRRLVPFPNQGHVRTDLTSRPLRFQTIRDYLIVYSPDEKPLVVIGVLHGRRSPRVLAVMLRERK